MNVPIMSQPHGENRKVLLIATGAIAGASRALLIFQPIPPVGLVAAIELAVLSVIGLFLAFFPKYADRMRQKLEPTMTAKDDPNEPVRWVP